MKQSTMQSNLFGIGEPLSSSRQPMAVYLDENETITELRRQLACTQDALSQKNEIIIRQENEIALRLRELHRALGDAYNARQETERKSKLVEKWKAISKAQESVIANLKLQSGKTTAMPKDVWRRLLQLCHPDKHQNAEAATAATQWLNANKPA